MVHSIYLVTNKINGKIYIGQTKKKDRWYYHVWEANNGRKSNMILHKAIRKYGAQNFTYQILVSGISKNRIDEYESIFIKSFESTNSSIGYNYLAWGSAYNGEMKGEKHPHFGKKNEKLAERNRLRIGIPSSVAQKEASSLVHKNVPKSEAQREKMSLSRKEYCKNNKDKVLAASLKGNAKRIGKSFKNKRWRSVRCIESGAIYENARMAGIKMGLGEYAGNNIRNQAAGILKTAYGLTFEFIM